MRINDNLEPAGKRRLPGSDHRSRALFRPRTVFSDAVDGSVSHPSCSQMLFPPPSPGFSTFEPFLLESQRPCLPCTSPKPCTCEASLSPLESPPGRDCLPQPPCGCSCPEAFVRCRSHARCFIYELTSLIVTTTQNRSPFQLRIQRA